MKTVNIVAIGLIVGGLPACSTTDQHSVEAWQGKVWRAVVVKQIVDTSSFKGVNKEWAAATKFDASRDTGLRMTRVTFSAGWNSVGASAIVPDNIEFSQLAKGALVDTMVEIGPNMNHETQRFTRVLRIVCAAEDDACFEAENKAGRVRQVVEENPSADISARYGLTFHRRVTKEELNRYD